MTGLTESRPLAELFAAVLKGPTPAEQNVFDRIAQRIFRERGLGLQRPPAKILGHPPSPVCPSCHRNCPHDFICPLCERTPISALSFP